MPPALSNNQATYGPYLANIVPTALLPSPSLSLPLPTSSSSHFGFRFALSYNTLVWLRSALRCFSAASPVIYRGRQAILREKEWFRNLATPSQLFGFF
jgi:hypothetical protein